MRKAMAAAIVGDSVYDEDSTTNELQELAAGITGKEAGLFVPSGTFGNQLCLFTHCQRGEEVIVDDNAHIIQHEAGAGAVIAGVQFRTFDSPAGKINPRDIQNRIRIGNDIHIPKTGLICIENARSDGRITPVSTMREIRNIAMTHNIPVHLDGARIFNATSSLGIDPKEISDCYDSMSFCLSKGLCAPVGSVVVGTKEFINEAKRKRKIMGGGMRQTGILAAAGIAALREMTARLAEDNKNALYLAEKLRRLESVESVAPNEDIHINMVFFKFKSSVNTHALSDALLKSGIKILAEESGEMRFVTHYWITAKEIDFCRKFILCTRGANKMDYAIMLCFDQNTEAHFKNIIASISDSGASSYMVDAKIPPHITIATFDTERIQTIVGELDNNVSNFKIGNVIWASVGAFVPNTLFAAPVMNEYLLNTCTNINNIIKPFSTYGDMGRQYMPYNWVPHTTLAVKLDNNGLKKAFDIALQKFTHVMGKCNRLLLVEWKCNPYKIIKTWDLI
ncbi:l-threonine aldolase-related [Holotrichia oblita]|nr:l-threonine aldolase-related [Holotrichia oblita]